MSQPQDQLAGARSAPAYARPGEVRPRLGAADRLGRRLLRHNGWQRVAYPVASIALLLLLWQALSWWVGSSVLPGPWSSVLAIRYSFQDGYLFSDIAITLYRMVGAFALALVASIAAGVFLGSSKVAERLFGYWVTIGASIPALVTIVVVYLWVGINDPAAMVATAIVVAPSMTYNIWDGMRAINPELSEMARAFGVTRLRIIRQVLVPQAVPFVFTAARAGWSLTWRIMIFVELVGRPSGVGYRIQYWFNLADMQRVIAAALPFVLLMLLFEFAALRPLERWLFRWRRAEAQ